MTISSISPFFIVSSLARSLAFYRGALGFELTFRTPETAPFFAIVRRDGAQLFLKEIGEQVAPLPNSQRHAWAQWDAFVLVPAPDTLAAEFASRGTASCTPLADTEDGLRGFEVRDPDGYVLFFGHPR